MKKVKKVKKSKQANDEKILDYLLKLLEEEIEQASERVECLSFIHDVLAEYADLGSVPCVPGCGCSSNLIGVLLEGMEDSAVEKPTKVKKTKKVTKTKKK